MLASYYNSSFYSAYFVSLCFFSVITKDAVVYSIKGTNSFCVHLSDSGRICLTKMVLLVYDRIGEIKFMFCFGESEMAFMSYGGN